jgi:hypothetical protein
MKLNKILKRDLTTAANERFIPVDLLIEQILSSQMMIEKHLSPDDRDIIMGIFKKYIQKKH